MKLLDETTPYHSLHMYTGLMSNCMPSPIMSSRRACTNRIEQNLLPRGVHNTLPPPARPGAQGRLQFLSSFAEFSSVSCQPPISAREIRGQDKPTLFVQMVANSRITRNSSSKWQTTLAVATNIQEFMPCVVSPEPLDLLLPAYCVPSPRPRTSLGLQH